MWKFLNDPNLFTVGIKIGAGVKKLASCNPLEETTAVNPTNCGGLLRFRLIGCLRPPPTIFRSIARSTAFCFCPTTSFRWTLLSRTSWLFRSPAIIRVKVLGSDQSYSFLDDDRQNSIDARFHCNRRRLIQIQVSSYDNFFQNVHSLLHAQFIATSCSRFYHRLRSRFFGVDLKRLLAKKNYNLLRVKFTLYIVVFRNRVFWITTKEKILDICVLSREPSFIINNKN